VIDVSDPTVPGEVGAYDTPGYSEGIFVIGGYAYVADGSAGLRVIDVSDPTAPIEVGDIATPGYARDISIAGSHAYLAGDGLRVIDISEIQPYRLK